MPLISVIVPVYKVEPYLHRCVDSILSQTFTNFELILVDDGSPDRCGLICDEYAAQDNRIIVIHQENKGLSAARNAGIDWAFAHSNSEWLSFVDSDDYIHPIYLDSLLSAAQGRGIAVCNRLVTDGENLPSAYIATSTLITPADLLMLGEVFIVAWCKLYKKEIFSTLRYPVGRIHEDAFITYKIMFQFESIPYISQPLYAYFRNIQGIMKSPWTPRRLDALDALEEQIAFYIGKGYPKTAEMVFHTFIKMNRDAQDRLTQYVGLTEREKQKLIRKVNRQLQRVLIRYRKYRWCWLGNRGKDLWIWSTSFRSIHCIHMSWRRLKKLVARFSNFVI